MAPTCFVGPRARVCTFCSAECVPSRSKSDKKAADFSKRRVLLHKMSLFYRANCCCFVCFHTDSGFDRDKFLFPGSSRATSPPSAATIEPPPASDDSSRVFRVGLGIRHLLRATCGGRCLPHPSLPSRLTISSGCRSREFFAVFPAGRKNRTNWRHFSCRQETWSWVAS